MENKDDLREQLRRTAARSNRKHQNERLAVFTIMPGARVFPLLAIMLLVSVCVASVSIRLLYHSAMETEMGRLVELVQSQARLVAAVARFDAQFSKEDHLGGAVEATLGQVRKALAAREGFGETGEFVLGRRSGDDIEFLVKRRHLVDDLTPISLAAEAAETMRRALEGKSGVMIGLDYRSVETIAAYEPLPELNAGLVAKVDLEEFRAPFVQASLISAVVALAVIGLGALLFKQIESHPPKHYRGPDFLEPVSGISPKERFFYLVLVMGLVAGAVIATPTLLIYNSSMEMARTDLAEMANSQARLIGAVAQFDAQYSTLDHPGGPAQATLSQVQDSLAEQPGFGLSGEFVLGQLEGHNIVFLLKRRHLDHTIPPIQMSAHDAEPMRRALQGTTGVITWRDYRAVEVLAAHEPVPELNIGLVAKIDLAELRAPFVHASLIAGGIALFIVLLGALSFSKMGPWVFSTSDTGTPIQPPFKRRSLPPTKKPSYTLIIFVGGLGLGVLVLDIVTPLGVAGGVPFVGFVLVGWWFPERRHIFILAVAASVFVLVGYLLAPAGGEAWVVLTNRVYAIFAVWVTTLILGIAKASETALESQARELRKLSSAVEQNPSTVIVTDPNGVIEYVNPKGCETSGYARDELLGQTPRTFGSGETPPEIYEDLWKTIRSGGEWRGELLNKKKNGEHFWENCSISPITDRNGETTHFVAVKEDITKRKQAERNLRSREELLRAVFDYALDGLIIINDHGIVESFNAAAVGIFGYPASDVVGRNISCLMPEPHRSHHDGYLENFRRTGETWLTGNIRELEALHRNGTKIPIDIAVNKFRVGDQVKFAGIVRDISARKDTERLLRRSQKMEAIGQLTGGISHDFNNLLGIIIGNLDFLAEEIGDDEALGRRLDTASRAALRGADLTRRLLAFSRQTSQAPTVVDVNTVVENMSDMLKKTLTAAIKVDIQIEPHIWLTEIDPGDLEDVILNLSLNARDAMSEAGHLIIETKNVTVDAETRLKTSDSEVEPGSYVALLVSDDGCGIPKDVIDKVFEPFFSTKEEKKGTGLGLSMVYGFAKRSKGFINIYSELGAGTTVRILLPVADETAVAMEAAQTNDAGSLPSGSETILLVDDEKELREVAGDWLSDLGYGIVLAEDANTALKILESNREIDLVFSDIVMPGSMDGHGLAKKAALDHPQVKVLLTSGFNGSGLRQGKFKSLALGMLSKPYRKSDLAQQVRQVLDS